MRKWMLVAGIALVAVLVVFALLFVLRGRKKHPAENGRHGFSVDSLVGTKGVVTEKIENIAGSGSVRAGGYSFAARALAEDRIFMPGEKVEIIAVEGVKLICRETK